MDGHKPPCASFPAEHEISIRQLLRDALSRGSRQTSRLEVSRRALSCVDSNLVRGTLRLQHSLPPTSPQPAVQTPVSFRCAATPFPSPPSVWVGLSFEYEHYKTLANTSQQTAYLHVCQIDNRTHEKIHRQRNSLVKARKSDDQVWLRLMP